MLVGLIKRNGKLHVGIVPRGLPSSKISFELSWMSEEHSDMKLNSILKWTTKTLEVEAFSIDTKEVPPSGTTSYATKYVLSYEINGKEKFAWFPRTTGQDSPSSDTKVSNALYNFLLIPGVENAKTSVGGWDKNSKLWKVHNDPAGLPTIGYGHKITGQSNDTVAFYSGGITDETAKALLATDCDSHVEYAKQNMGGCWSNLDFWAKVAYAELVYNIGKEGASAKFPNFKASLVQKNYGSPANLNDPPASPNSKSGVTFREFKRTYKDAETGEAKFCTGRHAHIIKHILIKLVAFKQSSSSAQDVSNTFETCEIEDYNESYEGGYANRDSATSSAELVESKMDQITWEESCKYELNLTSSSSSESFEIDFKKTTDDCECASKILETISLTRFTTCDEEEVAECSVVLNDGQAVVMLISQLASGNYKYKMSLVD